MTDTPQPAQPDKIGGEPESQQRGFSADEAMRLDAERDKKIGEVARKHMSKPQPAQQSHLAALLDAVEALIADIDLAEVDWEPYPVSVSKNRLRAAAAAVRAEMASDVRYHPDAVAVELDIVRQQAARDALAPIRECGLTPEWLERLADAQDSREMFATAMTTRTHAAALRKAMGQ